MKTLIKPQTKVKIVSLEKQANYVQLKHSNLQSGIDIKFYQKLFLVFFALFIFLIFPESPQDSESLCKKYHSNLVCSIW